MAPAITPLFPLKTWCEQKNLPYTTMRDRAKAGEFPTITIGKLTYVEIPDMDRWIESRKEAFAR